MVYVFGINIPLVEIVLGLVLIFIVLMILTIISYAKSRKQQKRILETLMKLELKEIEELDKILGLDKKEKLFLEEIKTYKNSGIDIVSGSQREKEKNAGFVFDKFISSPDIQKRALKKLKGLSKKDIRQEKKVFKKAEKQRRKMQRI